MKIYIIRHAKVDMTWPEKCNSKEFDDACKKYDQANILDVDSTPLEIKCKKIYVSRLFRSKETAKRLFPKEEYFEIEVGEVPLKSYKDCDSQIALWKWNVMGRLQWFFYENLYQMFKEMWLFRCWE